MNENFAFNLARLLRDYARDAEQLRTVLATVEHRLVEMQQDADAYGATSLGTKLYALRQFVGKYRGGAHGDREGHNQ